MTECSETLFPFEAHFSIRFVNGFGDTRASMRAGLRLRKNRRRSDQSGEDNYGEEPRFAKHGSPSYAKTCPRHISGRTATAVCGAASLRREYSMARSSWAENSSQDVVILD